MNLIIDGNNLLHRVWWIASNSAKSNETLHISMFLNSLKLYKTLYNSSHMYVCWDERLGKADVRRQEFPEYKANRCSSDKPNVYEHTDIIKEFVKCLGGVNFFPLNHEADDCIAFLANTLKGKKIIVTCDRDMCLLVDDDVVVYDARQKKEINTENFEEIMKVKQKDFLLSKILNGDKSDNVPGIKGVTLKKWPMYESGEKKLSDEQQAIFNRNKLLFSLDRYKSDSEELKSMQLQLIASPEPFWSRFLHLCELYNFNKILMAKTVWYTAFFETRKLQDLFTDVT